MGSSIPETKRQVRNRLYREELEDIGKRVSQCLRKGSAYRSATVNLSWLSEQLGIDERKIHRAIQTIGEHSFTTMVNKMRLDEARRRLTHERWNAYTIEEIGLSVGFVSRQSFHLVFRREVGCSPAEYRRNHTNKSDKR